MKEFLEYFIYTFLFSIYQAKVSKKLTKINDRQNVSKQDKSLIIIRRDEQVDGSYMLVVL